MKKRIMALLVGLSLILAATGCGKKYEIGENGEVYNDYVKVLKWEGLEITKITPVEVTEADIDDSIASDIETEWEKIGIKDRAAADGDKVVIDYVGKKDGVAFKGGSAEDFVLHLGSKSFIDGFETGVVGHNPGETFDLNLTFPKLYSNPDLAGQQVVFTVTLDAILPEFTDELVPKLSSKAKTTEEYRAEVRENLEKNNAETAEETMRTYMLDALLAQCEVIQYPEEKLAEYVENFTKIYTAEVETFVASMNMTMEEFEAEYNMTAEDMVVNTYGMTFEQMGQSQLLIDLAIELIAEVEDIDFSDKEYQEFLKEHAEKRGLETGEEYEKSYEETYGKGSCKAYCLQEKVVDYLMENCSFVENEEAAE